MTRQDSNVLTQVGGQHLPTGEQQQFADELVATARACASVQQFEPLLAEVAAWRSTAQAYAAGWDKVEVDWLDEPDDVTRKEPDIQD